MIKRLLEHDGYFGGGFVPIDRAAILKLLNTGGVHYPTVLELKEVAYLTMPYNIKDEGNSIMRSVWMESRTLYLISKFEELVRGKWIQIPSSLTYLRKKDGVQSENSLWQHVELNRGMFVCEAKKPKPEPFKDMIEDEAYKKALRNVWFSCAEFEIQVAFLNYQYLFNYVISKPMNVLWTENFVNRLIE